MTQIKQFFVYALLIVTLASCDKSISNREEYLSNIKAEFHSSIPKDFIQEKWNKLPFPYCFVFRTIESSNGTKTMIVIGNTEENIITDLIELDPYLLLSFKSSAQENSKAVVVKFPENVSELKKDELNLDKINQLFKKMKELKGFSWNNDKQNRLVSQILAATQLRGISSSDDKITEQVMKNDQLSHESQLKQIYAGDHSYNIRALIRYQPDIDFGQIANGLGFRSQMEMSKIYSTGERRHINYFSNDSILTLKNPKDLITYSPIIAFDKTGNYFPIVKFMVFSYELDAESFPIFSKQVIYLSIFDGKIISLK